MEWSRQAGFKLNYEKYVIKTKSCTFFGNVYTPQGVMPDPKKIETIKKMQAPQIKQELQSFLGMGNYLGQFKDMPQLKYNMMFTTQEKCCFSGQKAMKLTSIS